MSSRNNSPSIDLVAVLDRNSRLDHGKRTLESTTPILDRSIAHSPILEHVNEDPISNRAKIIKKLGIKRPNTGTMTRTTTITVHSRPSSSCSTASPSSNQMFNLDKVDIKLLDSIYDYQGDRDSNNFYQGSGHISLSIKPRLDIKQKVNGRPKMERSLSASVGCLTSVKKLETKIIEETPLLGDEFQIEIETPRHTQPKANPMNYEILYEGNFERGFMNDSDGYFEFLYSETKGPTYKGNVENNQFEGKCKITWEDGSYYEGEVKNGLRDGFGVFISGDHKSKYEGEWKEGKRHGKGFMTYSAHETFEGTFSENKRNGTGLMHYKSGNYYEGEWKNNKREGQGTMHWVVDPLEVYEGQWINDLPDGIGKHTYLQASGKKCNYYEGSFSEGKREGQGTFYYADGSYYSGEWYQNLKHGNGIFYYLNGTAQKGVWREDKLSHPLEFVTTNTEKSTPPATSKTTTGGTLTSPMIELYINDLLLKVDGTFDGLNKVNSLVQRNIRKFKNVFAHYCKYGIDPLCIKKTAAATASINMNPRISIQGILESGGGEEMTASEMKIFLSKDNKLTMVQFWKFAHDFGLLNENVNFAVIDRIFIFVATQSSAERNIKLAKQEDGQLLLSTDSIRNIKLAKPAPIKNGKTRPDSSSSSTSTIRFREFVEALVRVSSELYRNINHGTSSVADRFKALLTEKINFTQSGFVPTELVSARSASGESVFSLKTTTNIVSTTNSTSLAGSLKTTFGESKNSLALPTQIITTDNILQSGISKLISEPTISEYLNKIFSYYCRYEGGGYITYEEELEWHGVDSHRKLQSITVKQFMRMVKDMLIIDGVYLKMIGVIGLFEDLFVDIVTAEPNETPDELRRRRIDVIIKKEMFYEDFVECVKKTIHKRVQKQIPFDNIDEGIVVEECRQIMEVVMSRFDSKP
ncbi:COG4642 domain-containing protein [Naegleria gruberi]|uniref:COG4642 domain-containing protein n=1 Tax=Naegleria gruberi TaxID=5762 RepID=D2V0Z1_NAEGR|nr:COG4642 domain-containing protein [Naegleria gruberi]EFC49811.1 COG4642 domain-containing protein [Naegleria gruberi]|eukprot:XP_002682555.1 COG4642 domain-containing protein [Naegleria gruberi strain NEG-M]